NIALPHVKTEYGALKIGLGITTLKTPIYFGAKDLDPVKYIFFLTALDNETHLNALSELVALFNEKEFYETLDNAKIPQEISDYILNYELNKLSK
ncbi:MAG: PTS sugar transporter subunit IIA, partial [Anaerorhabdus sp.]